MDPQDAQALANALVAIQIAESQLSRSKQALTEVMARQAPLVARLLINPTAVRPK